MAIIYGGRQYMGTATSDPEHPYVTTATYSEYTACSDWEVAPVRDQPEEKAEEEILEPRRAWPRVRNVARPRFASRRQRRARLCSSPVRLMPY